MAERLTVAPRNTAQLTSSTLSLALLFNDLRALVRT